MKKLFLNLIIIFTAVNYGTAQQLDVLPKFESMLNMEDNRPFTSDSLAKEGVNVLIFFDPGCGHCQELVYGINKSYDKLPKTVGLYFISLQEKKYVDGMFGMFGKGLIGKPNIHLVHDPEGQFILKFNPQNFPFVYIYNAKSKKMIKYFNGEGNFDQILPFLKARTDGTFPSS